MHALIFNDKVEQLEEKPFPVHPDMIWVDVKDVEVEKDFIYKDGQFSPPEKPEPKSVPRDIEKELLYLVAQVVLGTAAKEDLQKFIDDNDILFVRNSNELNEK